VQRRDVLLSGVMSGLALLDWQAIPGDHAITSRAIDTAGTRQPAMGDPVIANQKTYWESNGEIARQVHIS
jgi:hypothetical protein